MMQINPEYLELADQDPVEAAKLQHAAAAMAPGTAELPGSFNECLRERLRQRAAVRPRRRLPRILGYAALLAVGAILGAALFPRPGTSIDPFGASVSWGQVVAAVEKVQQFHVTLIADEPRNNDRAKLYRIEWFYRHPGIWRAQGLDYVQFAKGGETKVWSIAEGKWVDPKTERVNLIKPEMNRELQKADMLAMPLSFVFGGKIPPGEPVKNPDLAEAGIEVFDYADAGAGADHDWARIWVLKASRMPWRMQVFSPQRDATMRMEFDYTDPQSEAFFDAGAFEEKVMDLRLQSSWKDPVRVYAIGSEPVPGAKGAKPRDKTQIFEVAGGYHAPEIREVRSNAQGDVAIFTSVVVNRSQGGNPPLEERYEDITDNWGNRYIYVGMTKDERAGEVRWDLTPVRLPLKTGAGPQRLTMYYSLKVLDNGQAAWRREVLAREVVEVPDASVQGWERMSGKAQANELAKAEARRKFFQSTAPLAEQLALVEAALAKDPASVRDMLWKLRLYRENGREEQGWKFYEAQLLERGIADRAIFYQWENERVVSEYVAYLASRGRVAEFNKLIERIGAIRKEDLASTDTRIKQQAQNAFNVQNYHPIAEMALLPEWMALVREQKPTVTKVIAARDGMVCVQLRVPKQPEGWRPSGSSSGDHWSIDYGWFWTPHAMGTDWRQVGQLAETATGEVWVAVAPAAGAKPASVTIADRIGLTQGASYLPASPENPLVYTWSLTADVPAATIDNMQTWWEVQTAGKNAQWFGVHNEPAAPPAPSPVVGWMNEADQARKDGNLDVALDLCRRIVAEPGEKWPDVYQPGWRLGINMEETRRDYRVKIAQMLAETGRLEEARKEADALKAGLPAEAALVNPADIKARRQARAAELALVRRMIADKKWAEAQQALDKIGAERPDLATVPDDYVNLSKERDVYEMRDLRQLHREAWREFDTLWWDLRDAGAKLP